MRSHEVTGMRVKHVKFDKFGAEVYVPSTKSQALWLRVIDSVPLLQAWLEQHPDRENREAYLFPGRNEGEPLSHAAFYLHLRAVSIHAHIKKKVSPHILRHSRLKWLKKYGSEYGISDSIICEAYGRWSPKNAHKMLDRYGRIDPHDANEIILKAHGKLRKEDVIAESLTEPQACPRCKADNDSLSRYCRVCGMVLDEEEAVKLMDRDEELRRIQAILDNPDVLAGLRRLREKK